MLMLDHSQLPATVSQVAKMVGLSTTTIRRYIAAGFLETEKPDDKQPLLIIGKNIRVRSDQWHKAFTDAFAALGVPSHMYGFTDSDAVCVLVGCDERIIPFSDASRVARRAREIVENALKGKQVEASD